MKTFLANHIEELWKYGTVAILAGFGGLVRYLSCNPENEEISHKRIFIEIIIAIFSGLIISFLLGPTHLNPEWKSAAAALAGYSSKGVLNIISNTFLKRVKAESEK